MLSSPDKVSEAKQQLEDLQALIDADLAKRERCLFAAIGEISGDGKLHLHDEHFDDDPIDGLDLKILLGKPPRMQRDVSTLVEEKSPLALEGTDLGEAIERGLWQPRSNSARALIDHLSGAG